MAVRPDLHGLEAFVAIADRGSFHKAAAHLGITQTALSHRMRKLETYVGVSLFYRTTRHVAITPVGIDLLPNARNLIEAAQQVFAQLSAEAAIRQDRLVIGVLPTLAVHVLPRVLADFAKTHPSVHVRIFDNSADEIAERVQRGEAEFGLTLLTTNRWDLELRPLSSEPFVLICRTDHPLAKKSSIRWREIEGQRLIRVSTQTGNRILIDDALGGASDRLLWTSEVQHVATAVALVAAGAGLTVAPQGAIDTEPRGNLTFVPLRGPSIARTIGIVTRRNIPLSPLAVVLLKHIETHLLRNRSSRRYS